MCRIYIFGPEHKKDKGGGGQWCKKSAKATEKLSPYLGRFILINIKYWGHKKFVLLQRYKWKCHECDALGYASQFTMFQTTAYFIIALDKKKNYKIYAAGIISK